MTETILAGRGRDIVPIPRRQWEHHLSKAPERMKMRLGFMSDKHHQVRYFVVKELPRYGKPLPPEFISQKLEMQIADVNGILSDLEKNLFFLVRNEDGAVSWAFPFTTAQTPHRLTFSTGEQVYAA